MQKRPQNWQLKVVSGGSSMYGRTPQILRKPPTKGQWKAVHGMSANDINTIYVLAAKQEKHHRKWPMEGAQ